MPGRVNVHICWITLELPEHDWRGWDMFNSVEHAAGRKNMSRTQQVVAGIIAIALVVTYSIVMTSSGGTASSWAWILLLAVFLLLAWTARSVTKSRADRRGG